MAQPFDCLCGTPTCRGTIRGARNMTPKQLEGTWLNGHIRALLDEQGPNGTDPTARALSDALAQAEKVVAAARLALRTYVEGAADKSGRVNGAHRRDGVATNGALEKAAALDRRGPTSRELSGEMSGDTVTA